MDGAKGETGQAGKAGEAGSKTCLAAGKAILFPAESWLAARVALVRIG